jgi:DNA repair exonuclease SbcCD ATPase subunit
MQISEHTYEPISYQGHGMIEKATGYNATAHVINHELHHLNQYRSIARNTGKEIVSENITLVYQFVNGKLIPVRGKAEAMMVDKESTAALPVINQDLSDSSEAETVNSQPEAGEKAARLEQQLNAQLNELQKRIEQLEQSDESGMQLANLENKQRHLEQLIAKLKGLKARIGMEELNGLQNDLLRQIEESAMAPKGMLDAIMGLKSGTGNDDKDLSAVKPREHNQSYNGSLNYVLQAMALSAGWTA